MSCNHLKELYSLCQTHNLRLSSTDLIRIVCPQCGVDEVCPSLLCEQFDARHPEAGTPDSGSPGLPNDSDQSPLRGDEARTEQ
jgi:hypothetical protein